jgi:hypothetical protein
MGVGIRWCAGAGVAALFSVAVGCGGDSTSDPVEEGRSDAPPSLGPGDPQPPGVYVGRWHGQTSQGYELAFLVEAGGPGEAVTFIGYTWQVAGCQGESSFVFPDPAPIAGGRLAARVERPTDSAQIGIVFHGGGRAEGSLALTVPAADGAQPDGCAGEAQLTFTATRR